MPLPVAPVALVASRSNWRFNFRFSLMSSSTTEFSVSTALPRRVRVTRRVGVGAGRWVVEAERDRGDRFVAVVRAVRGGCVGGRDSVLAGALVSSIGAS